MWTDPRGPVSEHYRHFAIRLGRTLKGLDAHTVLVTSAARAEGKTTTSCNLALALASVAGGRQVALCELDLRRPAVSEELRVRPEVGIEELLAGSARLEDVRLRTNVPDLDLYLASQPAAAPLELLSAPALGAALRELGRRYDIVVIDSPPVLPVPDVPLILRHADAAVPVARMGITRRAAFQEMLTTLGNEKIVGCFLNQSGTPRHRRYYGYYAEDAEPAKRAAGEEPAT